MRIIRTLSMVAVAVVSMVVVTTTPALANDYELFTYGFRCSIASIDEGPGQPGGGRNDDYFRVWDIVSDNDGCGGWVWVDGRYYGGIYNGRGSQCDTDHGGCSVFWDPVQITGGPHTIGLKVCSMDGPNRVLTNTCVTSEHVETG
jgi:hypothetical protein